MINNKDDFIICDDNYHKACKTMFKILNCNLLWVMSLDNNSLNMLVTDPSLVNHYLDQKYYLSDPNLINDPNLNCQSNSAVENIGNNLAEQPKAKKKSAWKVTMGTDCESFTKSGFLPDLYKKFNIEEFVSFEKTIGSKRYCFRFFTRNNRFVFMNKLINDMPLIKHFMSALVKQFKIDLRRRPGLSLNAITGLES